MARAYKEYIIIEDKSVPVNVYIEWRSNVRISIGKLGINLRIPKISGSAKVAKYLELCREWTHRQIEKDPKLRARLFRKVYKDGDRLLVGDKSFLLRIYYENRKMHSAILEEGEITLKLSNQDTADHIQSSIRKMLSRVISNEFLPGIVKKVNQINDRYFQEDIKSVRLKYNQSNWGSCSAKKNINLSSRLLFAPDDIVNYVIVHELAHLKELNHSKKYWKIVEGVIPDYKKHEKWLKDFGYLCDF